MSPTLNGSSTLERFEGSNVIEIRNAIMFDFYLGLPHIRTYMNPHQIRLSTMHESLGMQVENFIPPI